MRENHKIAIPEDTLFIGGMHNTTNDTIELYDVDKVPEVVQRVLDEARGKNALERCQRFLLAEHVKTPAEALVHVFHRSQDPAEVRPELNHSSNAAVVIGRRSLTIGHFLDRRVFLPSYDPYSDDERGTNLESVLGPALIVCSGINLEYLFSTIEVEQHGAGTKAPLNVVGNSAVLQGTMGDIKPGLPTQMTEMHIPVRALFVIDAPLSRVEGVLKRRAELALLVRNEWVRFLVRDPESGNFFRFSQGKYVEVAGDDVDVDTDFVPFVEHKNHGLRVANREFQIYLAAVTGMVASCVGPIIFFAG